MTLLLPVLLCVYKIICEIIFDTSCPVNMQIHRKIITTLSNYLIYFQCIETDEVSKPDSTLWHGYYINYTLLDTNYTGIDSMKLVAQDGSGTYSDVISVVMVIMEEKCLNGGKCKSNSASICSILFQTLFVYLIVTFHVSLVKKLVNLMLSLLWS